MNTKILVALLFFFVIVSHHSLFGQQSKTTGKVAADFTLKSKKQNKTAWILLGSGAVLMTTSFIIPRGEPQGEILSTEWFFDVHENDDIKSLFLLTGAGSTIASIPFFLASGRNKRKAADLSFKQSSAPVLHSGDIKAHSILSLNLKIQL